MAVLKKVSETMKSMIQKKMTTPIGKKVFLYVEQTDGGMDVHVITSIRQLKTLYHWMDDDCWMDDAALLDWFITAEVGDVHHHRLGIAVRVKDATM